jgi:hypothetical protein
VSRKPQLSFWGIDGIWAALLSTTYLMKGELVSTMRMHVFSDWTLEILVDLVCTV